MAVRLARLSGPAHSWLKEEIAYIAARNPGAARRLIQKMRAARELIGRFPLGGEAGQIPGTRRFVVDAYVLTVRAGADGGIEIAAIRHSRQEDARTPDIPADDGGGA